MATLSIVVASLLVPFTPLATVFGFSRLPYMFLLLIGVIVILYIGAAEIAKKAFYRMVKF
jgi:Mg2+-importing ATPase